MKRLALVLALLMIGGLAHGHGNPAKVTVAGGRLVLDGNVADVSGYASELLAETDPAGWLSPISQDRLFSDFPGFDLTGVAVGSELWIEPLAPVADLDGGPAEHAVWHWSAASQGVAPVSSERTLDLVSARGFGFRTLVPGTPPPDAMPFMQPLAQDIDDHAHPLYYVMPDASTTPAGAYGFFARLDSPAYEASAPFFVGLNYGLSASAFVEATRQINLAAAAEPLDGDFNADGLVNQSDYAVWRDAFGTTSGSGLAADGNGDGLVDGADYTLWRDAVAASPATTPIPEPGGAALLLVAVVGALARRRAVAD